MNSRMMISSVDGSSMPKFCWMKKGSYYYYYNSRGKLLRNGTYQIKGKNYCFDKY